VQPSASLEGERNSRFTFLHRESAKRLLQWVQMLLGRYDAGGKPIAEFEDIREYGAMLKEQIKEWEKELRDEGIKEGIEKGEAEVLSRQLERKFGEIPAAARQQINAASSAQLLTWAARILSAEKIEDMFQA